MKNLLILISFLLLSSPLNGQSSRYESVSQCVIQTMKENKLTGNKMFEMVKDECERSLGNANKSETESILYLSDMDSGKRANCLQVTKLLPANDRLNYMKICGVILENKKDVNSNEPDKFYVDPLTGYKLNLSKVGGRADCMLVVKILPANDRIKLLRGCGLVD